MKSIVVGKAGKRKVSVNIPLLLKTRALVQAGSGGGKSYFLRLLAESLFGKVQTLIIDREGEFASLREKYAYLLAGEGGDTPTDVRSARLLAERLLELRVSAVCDLYESFRRNPRQRQAWVRAFLEGIMDAPKKFWRPLVVIVDEAHLFAPEVLPKAANQTEREIISGCKDAMVALATAGRKRGFCSIWATQRLAKLDKDASAELLNRFIGHTVEDVDVDRAVELMSVSKGERAEFKKTLKDLDPGNFFGFGRAFSKDRILFKVGSVRTMHPESGSTKYTLAPPPAPEKVRALLPRLKDLPKEVDAKVKTEAALRAEVRALKAELAKRHVPVPAAPVSREVAVKVPVVKAVQLAKLQQALTKFRRAAGKVEGGVDRFRRAAQKAESAAGSVKQFADAVDQALAKMHRKGSVLPAPVPKRSAPRREETPPPKTVSEETRRSLGKPECAVLGVLAQYPEGCVLGKLTLLSGYRPSGGFKNSLSALRTKGLMEGLNTGIMRITSEGMGALDGDYTPLPEGPELARYWLEHPSMGKCERAILKALLEYPDGLTLQELTEKTKYRDSGGFKNALSALRTANVIEGKNTERMRAKPELLA